jgi:hypothetical protein
VPEAVLTSPQRKDEERSVTIQPSGNLAGDKPQPTLTLLPGLRDEEITRLLPLLRRADPGDGHDEVKEVPLQQQEDELDEQAGSHEQLLRLVEPTGARERTSAQSSGKMYQPTHPTVSLSPELQKA